MDEKIPRTLLNKNICRKLQGFAEEGNSCLETLGTCESCPELGKVVTVPRPIRSQATQILLNIQIPGEPIAQERHRWGKHTNYDPNAKDKKAFQWLVKAACPALKPFAGRLGIELHIWTKKGPIKTRGDYDNFAKFIGDACNCLVWLDDSQIDDAHVIVHNASLEPRIELKVWEL